MNEQNEQRKLSEINRPMNEELFNNLEKQYQELAKVKAESEQNEKQAIEEMASVLEQARIDALATIGSMNHDFGTWYAKACYNAGYRKQSEGEWIIKGLANPKCSACNSYNRCGDKSDFCPNCGAHMKGEGEQ